MIWRNRKRCSSGTHFQNIYRSKDRKGILCGAGYHPGYRAGSFVTLLGPSGCGKTTTLRMIAGFESPDEGDIYLGDEAINALTPNKRDTAMVFQSYAPSAPLQCI